tara:strand:+ start:4083 stop:4520 length:438 start_codon:yes stop_codon:yes gene_type:complete
LGVIYFRKKDFLVSEKDSKLKEFALIQLKRNITNLYKNYIILAEELQKDHDIFLKKIEKHVPAEYIKDVDYFDSNRYTYLRKRILDMGNELNRDLEKYFDLIDVSLNEEALSKIQNDNIKSLISSSKKATVSATEKGYKVKGKLL